MRWLACVALSLALSGCLQSLGLGPAEVAPDQGWPDADDARLRPGTQLFVAAGENSLHQCTAGFLFRSADNGTLYLSFAAHCLGQGSAHKSVGTDVLARDDSGDLYVVGDVAYDGWATGQDLGRDFALVALRNVEGVRDETHPALKHWGGPTGMADSGTLVPGTEVVTYAASSQRGPEHEDNVKQGRFLLRDQLPPSPLSPANGSGQLVVRLDPPSQGGDSGSGLMLADGAAAGILSLGGQPALGGQPIPESKYSAFVPLDEAVGQARAAGGDLAGLRLVTWRQFEQPSG